jgi:inner membrane protein
MATRLAIELGGCKLVDMEPVTHLLTGACLSRAGLNKKAAYATLAITLAAEFPDIDVLWSVEGPVAGFQHHRGITHTFLGVPFEAALIVGLVWVWHRVRVRRGRAETAAPVNWWMLWAGALIGLLSHLLLDYTNNYGLRPFFPFNPRWYAGSIVFIFEPVIFALLVGALVMPMLFGLIGAEVGARKPAFRGQGWAIAALLGICGLWVWRVGEHEKAVGLAAQMDLSGSVPEGNGAVAVGKISASPYPVNPYKWHLVVEGPGFYQIGTANTLTGAVESEAPRDVFYLPQTTVNTLAAKRTRLGEAYLDWSQFPVVTDVSTGSVDPDDPKAVWVVTFRDLRFAYDVAFMKGRTETPLTGKVVLDGDRRVVRMEMDGRAEQ